MLGQHKASFSEVRPQAVADVAHDTRFLNRAANLQESLHKSGRALLLMGENWACSVSLTDSNSRLS